MYRNQNTKLKAVQLFLILFCSPLFLFSQTLTGLWTGVFSNDSNSVRKDQSYEIALTEYRGKVFGYSRAEFIVRDTLYYVVKRIKGTIEGDVCEVKDVEILSDNFPTRPDKGVKVSSFFRRNKKDSTWVLDGKWKTNSTKKYYSVTGNIDLKEEKDLSVSKLFPHLQELNLDGDVAFYQEQKKEKAPVAMKKAEPEKKSPVDEKMVASIAQPEMKKEPEEEVIVKDESLDRIKGRTGLNSVPEKSGSVAKIENGLPNSMKPIGSGPQKPVKTEPIKTETVKTETFKTETVRTEPVRTDPIVQQKNNSQKPETEKSADPFAELERPTYQPTVAKATTMQTPAVATTQSSIKKETVAENLKPRHAPVTSALPAIVESRKSEFSQYVNFKSDSLELSLYDNGEVDGDTVTIYLNGEILLSKQGLKATAIKKTIYLTPGKDDEFKLILFADNLGKYPPNTGLLIVHDGDDVYNLRFSADLEKNAGVLFKRKK